MVGRTCSRPTRGSQPSTKPLSRSCPLSCPCWWVRYSYSPASSWVWRGGWPDAYSATVTTASDCCTALDSSETERRRIAADLHDGVVQDLAGVSYSLAALSDRVDDPAARRSLERTATTTRGAVRSLRSLLVDIYPASLASAGLTASISDLLAGLPPTSGRRSMRRSRCRSPTSSRRRCTEPPGRRSRTSPDIRAPGMSPWA